MPLSRTKKEEVVASVSDLLNSSKMTVIATYQGTSVKDMQSLRREAKQNGTTIKVVKNRLVVQALKGTNNLKDLDTNHLSGMLAYAFNPTDEVAPAQSLANFAKNNPTLSFVGAISADGNWLDAEQVKSLAELPSKPELIASVVLLIGSPLRNVVNAVSSQLPNVLAGLQAKAS